MRLLQQNEPGQQNDANEFQGNYAALFEIEESTTRTQTTSPGSNPLDELNTLIAEMIAAAQGEDQVRAWARRLSHILEAFHVQQKGDECAKGDKAGAMQERLL
jgi:hypothetical protein